jgi:hypothetical protein
MSKKCLICGKKIPSWRKFCSFKCYGKYRSIYFIGKNNPKYKKEERICQYCGKKFFVFQSRIKRGRDKHCSRRCTDLHKKQWMIKEKNPNWKGGRYIRKDGYIRLNLGKKRVLEHRYVLGVYDKNLVVHHKDGNPSNNDPDNLVVLTRGEHTKLHLIQKQKSDNYPFGHLGIK